jgi:hypothetical protein
MVHVRGRATWKTDRASTRKVQQGAPYPCVDGRMPLAGRESRPPHCMMFLREGGLKCDA